MPHENDSEPSVQGYLLRLDNVMASSLLHLRADQTSSKFQAPEIAWLEVFLPPSALYGV